MVFHLLDATNRISTLFLLLAFFLWYRVVSRAAPGVARRHTFYCEPSAFYRAVFAYCLDAVVGARRGVAAVTADERRECVLIDFYQ